MRMVSREPPSPRRASTVRPENLSNTEAPENSKDGPRFTSLSFAWLSGAPTPLSNFDVITTPTSWCFGNTRPHREQTDGKVLNEMGEAIEGWSGPASV
jgi:hypothetical protein